MHTHTHKQETADARKIRNQILLNFELATQLTTSEEERRQLLHFVIVGGGPTGVEFGAEFYDFLNKVQKSMELSHACTQKIVFLVQPLIECRVSYRIFCWGGGGNYVKDR